MLGDPINHTDRRGLIVDCDGTDDDCSEADDATIYDSGAVFYATVTAGGGGGGESCEDDPYQAACGGDPAFCAMFPGACNSTGNTQQTGNTSTLNVNNFTTTGTKAQIVQNDLRWLQQAIAADPSCDKWLQGSSSAINYMLDAPGSGATMMGVGVGSFDPTVNAFAGSAGSNVPSGTLITVNLNGAFFNSGSSSSVGYGVPSWITGGSYAAQALILLHELAHDLGVVGFLSDRNNPTAQTSNNQAVMSNCGNVVNLAAGKN